MYIYNITIGIDKSEEEDWMTWIRSNYIPGVMKVGVFSDYRMYRILNEGEQGIASYCLQFSADKLDPVVHYLEEQALAIAEEHRDRFKDKHVAFSTLLEEI